MFGEKELKREVKEMSKIIDDIEKEGTKLNLMAQLFRFNDSIKKKLRKMI